MKFGQTSFIIMAVTYVAAFLLSITGNTLVFESSYIYALNIASSILLFLFFKDLLEKSNEKTKNAIILSVISSLGIFICNLGLFFIKSGVLNNILLVVNALSYALITFAFFLMIFKVKNIYSKLSFISFIITLIFAQLMLAMLLNTTLNLGVVIDLSYISVLCVFGVLSSLLLFNTYTKIHKNLSVN